MLANLIAIPVVYIGISQWFENYAHKIKLGWWFFTIPAIVILSIAMVTISLQTIRVALRNPVESLKHE
jgi:putative ABC transport system permease protein